MDLFLVAFGGVCGFTGLIGGYVIGVIAGRFQAANKWRDTYPVQRDTYPDDLTKRA